MARSRTLTNAARHGLGRADVKVAFEPDDLEITVTNRVRPGVTADVRGHGIEGMSERVGLVGVTLAVDRRESDFCVRARLPYSGSSA